MKLFSSTTVITLATVMALAAGQAQAQSVADATGSDAADVTSEIIVTAQRRAERSVDVPITVTTLGSEQLATANVRDLADITKITPSLRFDSAAAFFQPTIRGVGTSVVTPGGGANVGIYVDGFYSPNPLAANGQLMNVQSVQVLKGPQGTLFGRNTTGGAILIQSAEPSEDTSAQFKASYGRFNQLQTQGYATTGLAPGFAVDLEGMYRRGDGFQTNIVTGNDKVGKYRSWSVRAGLKADLTDGASLLVRYQHSDINDPTSVVFNSYVDPVLGIGAPSFAPAGSFTTKPNEVALDQRTFFKSISNVVQATLNIDAGFADFTSYSQYRRENSDISEDLDGTAAKVFQIGIPIENETFSQEFLLNSKPGGKLQWTAGLFYFSNRDTYETYLDLFAIARTLGNRLGGSSTTTRSAAAFIDATYEISPQLFVTAGARYAHDEVVDAKYVVGPLSSGGAPLTAISVPSIKSDRVTPRFVLRYKPSDQSSIYASFTRGYKAAVIDAGGSCQNPVNLPSPSNPTGAGFTCNDVKPEKIDAYEVGFKYGSQGLSLEAAGFYYDYKNLQISVYSGSGLASITNAATSEIYGLEGALRYEFSDAFEINLGASWTHARYKEFVNAPIYARCPGNRGCSGSAVGPVFPFEATFPVVSGTTLRNTTMQRTPEFTGNIGARYRTDLAGGKLQVSGNLYYTSSFNFGPSGVQFPQKGYEVVSARVQWTDPSETYTLALWGENLTNKRFLTAVQYNSFGLDANWNQPVTYGVELSARF
ncbi:TonB-dependent receptor [Novosphingobium sp. PS1R-30]|uniref:TonB-dependent receptor n=1 Tax=Novosphingobium anseongense TaxID=3133436 RepID=A0ABU8S0J1_9SPHN